MLQPGRGLVVEKVFQLAKESSSWLENLFLKLVETLAGWKSFSTRTPRDACNIGEAENLFDDDSSGWLQL